MKNKFLLFYNYLLFGLLLTLIICCHKDNAISSKKNPIVSWATPSDITFGTVLSDIQLNAQADVPGNFVYSPALGVKLNLGTNQDLKVDFYPTDATSYNLAIKSVKINVIQTPVNGGVTSIVFNPLKTYGTMTDVDGNVYKTITIGTQTWMAENLRVTKYRNGIVIPNVLDILAWSVLTTGAYCNYLYSTDNKDIATYGRLYNWFAVVDSRNIAPIGWHVPTIAEWTTLIRYLGTGVSGGNKMKETGTTHWQSPNNSTNDSGFSAIPAGLCHIAPISPLAVNGPFWNRSYSCYWWSSSIETANFSAWAPALYFDTGVDLNGRGAMMNLGYSVRLLKD